MSAIQLPLTLAQRHNNQQLFSDHYLNVTLPQRPEWKLLAHDARPVLEQIAEIVRAYVPSQNEAQTEDDQCGDGARHDALPALPPLEHGCHPVGQDFHDSWSAKTGRRIPRRRDRGPFGRCLQVGDRGRRVRVRPAARASHMRRSTVRLRRRRDLSGVDRRQHRVRRLRSPIAARIVRSRIRTSRAGVQCWT